MLGRVRDYLLRAYCRTPEHPTKYRVVRWLGRNAFPAAGVVAPAYGGLRLRLHPRDWAEYMLLRGVPYEWNILALLEANLRPGDAAALAGVHVGLHVAVAARAVGPSGRVVGVEPQPATLCRARENLLLNGLGDNVTLVAAALGAADALAPVAWADPLNPATASLLDPPDRECRLAVPVVTLAGVAAALGLGRLRLFLLDVEGYEGHVLAGLAGMEPPEVVVVEAFGPSRGRAGGTVAGLLRAVEGMGYRLHTPDGRPVDADSAEVPGHNVVGVLPGAAVAWVPADPG